MNTTTQEKDTGKNQARMQVESIAEMIAAYEHANDIGTDCEDTPCKYAENMDMDHDNAHDPDKVRERIEEDPLSVEVRSAWHSAGAEPEKPDEWRICLCTGRPAVFLEGEFDLHGQPDSVRVTHAWWSAWEEYHEVTPEQEAALLDYARMFYFGE